MNTRIVHGVVTGVLVLAVIWTSLMLIAGHRDNGTADCLQNGHWAGNDGPCVYNPRVDTCPEYDIDHYYGNDCIEIHIAR